ncbi:DNA-binding protein [Enterococcus gallinarum]|uniref:DNA-binding protein n=1 Tax=Enterococcus gallinarum TaxID=1353 RepID=UPI0037EC3547|nr:DNA-binding protein [Enterococcus gallinarum]
MPEIDEKTIQFILKKYVPKRYLNQREACIYAGTSPKTMNEWIKRGLKQIVFNDDSNPKYDVRDIDDFMEKHKIGIRK